jgi:WD40 repeat protein
MEASVAGAASGPAPLAYLRGHTSSVTAVHVQESWSTLTRTECAPAPGQHLINPAETSGVVVSGDSDGNLMVWDLSLLQLSSWQPGAHTGAVLSVEAEGCNEQKLLTYGRDGLVKIWNLEYFQQHSPSRQGAWLWGHVRSENIDQRDDNILFRAEPHGFCRMGVLENESPNRVVAVTSGGTHHETLCIWDSRLSKTKPALLLRAERRALDKNASETFQERSAGMCLCLRTIPARYQILASYENNLLNIWDYRGTSEQPLAHARIFRQAQPPLSMDYRMLSPAQAREHDQEIAVGGADGQVALLRCNAALGLFEHTRQLTVARSAIVELAYRPVDYRLWVAGCGDGYLRVLSTKQPFRKLALLKKHRGSIRCLSYARSGTILASGSDDMGIALWKPYPSSAPPSFDGGVSNDVITVSPRP